MRCAFGLVLAAFCLGAISSIHAQPPRKEKTEREKILEQFQEQFRIAAETAEPSIATIIVSRSEYYPKVANQAEIPGKLGEFDLKEFLKSNTSLDKKKLGDFLDLSKVEMIPNHGYIGGVVIDPSGLILTPYHAIEGARKIFIFLPNPTGGKPLGSYADIIAADSRSDLAVLKLIQPPENLKPISLADVQMEDRGSQKATMFKGKMVGLIFTPYSSALAFNAKPGIYFGAITNTGHRFTPPIKEDIQINKGNAPSKSESYYRFGKLLEHDITRRVFSDNAFPPRKTTDMDVPSEPVNPGTTGGVLIDLNGKMVGMTASTAVIYDSHVGPGYAIPIDDNARKVIEVLRKGEEVEYGFLGISLDDDVKSHVIINRICPSSPAELAGLRRYDIIRLIDGAPTLCYEDLLLLAGSSLAGTEIKITIERGWRRENNKFIRGESSEVKLTLGKLHHTNTFIASARPEPVYGLRVDYLNYPQTNEGFPGNSFPVTGVSIREVVANSPAELKFKDLGQNASAWIISHVNGTAISSPADFYRLTKGQKTVKLTLRDWDVPNRHELILP